MDNIYAPTSVKILDVASHTPTERTFTLDARVSASPGQFVMVSLPHVGEAPIAISTLGDASIAITVRDAGKVTGQLFQRNPGDEIFLRGPYGRGFPVDIFEGQPLLVIAGGSGIAAVKPLVEHYLHSRCSSKVKQLDVLVGFRSPKHVLFKADLKRWDKNFGVVVTVDTHEDEDESWFGGVGFVVDFIQTVKNIGPETFVVVTGPPKMMSNSVNELLRHQVAPERIWLSFERHMCCGVGKCGHCRIREKYVCVDGPVFNYIDAREMID